MDLWKVKLAAFLHDPIVKPLILMRGEAHEKIAEEEVKEVLGEELWKLRKQVEGTENIEKADRWASAVDRPVGLRNRVEKSTPFPENPVFVHPLSGEQVRMQAFGDDLPKDAAKALGIQHLKDLRPDGGENIDWRATFFSFWRFAPETPAKGLGGVWQLMPADTRVPDHSIWEHLSLVSAFAGAFAADPNGEVALGIVSFGPVQGFIGQARKVEDFWAGSHLLSVITGQAIWHLAKKLGPDAILFPQLRGLALVDAWIYREIFDGWWPNEKKPIREDGELRDDDPLFSAALPNRFVFVAPASQAEALAKEAVQVAKAFVQQQGEMLVARLAEATHLSETAKAEVQRQVAEQLKELPEGYWSIVDWRLAGDFPLEKDGLLKQARKALGAPEEYLGKLREVLKDGAFFDPNPGIAYPGLYELAERAHAAAKSARTFAQQQHEGYRCTICGERAWIGEDPSLRNEPVGKRDEKRDLWKRLAKEHPGKAKEGEHLCAWCALKRFWPELFIKWLGIEQAQRFVVSTHVMALATTLEEWIEDTKRRSWTDEKQDIAEKIRRIEPEGFIALPRRTASQLMRADDLPEPLAGKENGAARIAFARKLVWVLDRMTEKEESTEEESPEEVLGRKIRRLFERSAESYYALIKLDGDKMGAWLSGEMAAHKIRRPDGQEGCRLTFGDRLRSDVRASWQELGERVQRYLAHPRLATAAWHQAISSSLNQYSARIVRFIVEEMFTGKLIYAGGDDVLAMVSVRDLLPVMLTLRLAYSGILPADWLPKEDARTRSKRLWKRLGADHVHRLVLGGGYAYFEEDGRKELLRMMGKYATASAGAIVAHHTAPLSMVLRLLNDAEHQAKAAGRDGFCLRLIKRAGGEVQAMGRWRLDDAEIGSEMGLLIDLARLSGDAISRRAIYAIVEILEFVPDEQEAIEKEVGYRLLRQAKKKKAVLQALQEGLPARLARAAMERGDQAKPWLRQFLIAAEFLGRAGRMRWIGANPQAGDAQKEAA